MQELSIQELIQIDGGFNLTASLISSLTKGVELSFEIGQCLGGALRRIMTGNFCEI